MSFMEKPSDKMDFSDENDEDNNYPSYSSGSNSSSTSSDEQEEHYESQENVPEPMSCPSTYDGDSREDKHWFFKSDANKMLRQCQFEHFLQFNKTNLEYLDSNQGKTLDSKTIQVLYNMCVQLNVEGDLVKAHALETYDRWVSTLARESMYRNTSDESRRELRLQIEREMFLRMATCIQLSSKYVGTMGTVGHHEIVSTADMKVVLSKFHCKVDIEDIIDSEFYVLKALNFNLNTLIPLEITPYILSLLQLEGAEFDRIFDTCIRISFFTYMHKEQIYQEFKRRVQKLYETNFTEEEMNKIECDYILRAAAIVKVSLYQRGSNEPRAYLEKLEEIIDYSSSSEHIYQLSLTILKIMLF